MLHVGLNLLFIIPGENGGTQVYSESLMTAMASLDKENQFTVYVSQEGSRLELPDQPNFHQVVCPVRSSQRLPCFLWQQLILPWQLRAHRVDLLHTPGGVGPIFPLCPQVATVHDINFIDIPFVMSHMRQALLRRLIPLFARRSAHVLTVSEFSSGRIQHQLHIPAGRITVTYNGPRDYVPLTEDAWKEIADLYHLDRPYLIAFGSLAAHKNIGRLIKAFTGIHTYISHTLVLAGHMLPGGELQSEINAAGLGDRIRITGFVPDSHVMPLMEHADLFVFPSLHEGFGIPLIEAQMAGVAVACSTAGALPEVAGEGAAFFDPLSVPDMERVLRDCLSDPGRRATLIEKGRANVRRFSWKKTAAETLACYRQVMNKSRGASRARKA